ncbi:hypothetical protein Tco_0213213 [Tanacetum coccineum]
MAALSCSLARAFTSKADLAGLYSLVLCPLGLQLFFTTTFLCVLISDADWSVGCAPLTPSGLLTGYCVFSWQISTFLVLQEASLPFSLQWLKAE